MEAQLESLNRVVVFVQVAETRSFVAAGRLLGVSASAVGKSVARMEERLGVRLFHRSTRSITLTAEGHVFLQRCRRILAEIEAAESELTESVSTPRGKLRISLPLVSGLVLPVLGDFMQHYPEVELDLDFSDRLVDVIGEGYDAVVRTGLPADSRLSARKLGNFRSLLVASPEYLMRKGTPAVPQDLYQHVCMHYRFPHSGKLETWPFREQSLSDLPCSMVCNDIETRVCFVLKGLGIACLPDFAVNTLLASGKLCEVLPDFIARTGVFHILWPASKHPSPKVRALIDFLCERVFPGHVKAG